MTMRLKAQALLVACCVVQLLPGCSSERDVSSPIPVVHGDWLVFSNGVELELDESQPLLDPGGNGSGVAWEITTRVMHQWQRVLVHKSTQHAEGGMNMLAIYDWDGKQVGEACRFLGELIVLDESERVFLAAKRAHFDSGDSMLISTDGEKIARLKHMPAFDFQISKDQRLIWVLSRDFEGRKPVSRVKAFSIDGEVVGESVLCSAGALSIECGGSNYRIAVPLPAFPG